MIAFNFTCPSDCVFYRGSGLGRELALCKNELTDIFGKLPKKIRIFVSKTKEKGFKKLFFRRKHCFAEVLLSNEKEACGNRLTFRTGEYLTKYFKAEPYKPVAFWVKVKPL